MTVVAWRGQPFPLGATWDGDGTNFSLFSEHAERSSCACSTRTDTRHGSTRAPDRAQLARLPARVSARPALRLPRARPLRARPRACASTPPSCCSIPTPRRSSAAHCRARQRAALRARPPTTRRRPRARRRGLTPPRCRAASSIDPAFDWEDDRRPRRRVGRDGDLRDPREGLHDVPPRDPRGSARHLCRRWPREPAIELPARSRRDRRRAAAGAPHRRRELPGRAGLSNYWGYSSIGYLAPHGGYAAPARSASRSREFKGMVKALHGAGIEVILDVVYNHTAEGNHLGPMLSLQGHRQPPPTTG